MGKREIIALRYCFTNVRFGLLTVVWSVFDTQPKVFRVLLPKPGVPTEKRFFRLFPYATAASCSEIDSVIDDIRAFLDGENISFSLDTVHLALCSEFQQKVLRAEHKIPRGRVSSYKRIAKHLGMSKAARAVGNALANNPFPIIIPCHRTIHSDGTIGGFGGGVKMKKALLKMEGILFDDCNQLVEGNFYY